MNTVSVTDRFLTGVICDIDFNDNKINLQGNKGIIEFKFTENSHVLSEYTKKIQDLNKGDYVTIFFQPVMNKKIITQINVITSKIIHAAN